MSFEDLVFQSFISKGNHTNASAYQYVSARLKNLPFQVSELYLRDLLDKEFLLEGNYISEKNTVFMPLKFNNIGHPYLIYFQFDKEISFHSNPNNAVSSLFCFICDNQDVGTRLSMQSTLYKKIQNSDFSEQLNGAETTEACDVIFWNLINEYFEDNNSFRAVS